MLYIIYVISINYKQSISFTCYYKIVIFWFLISQYFFLNFSVQFRNILYLASLVL